MITFFKLYSPEIYLIFSGLSLLIYNSYIINKFKHPILNFEIFFQNRLIYIEQIRYYEILILSLKRIF